ncbi:MAG: 30S ribosomal protein S21 [Leptospiraceae bacterium]|nr:30S ribosomal protein S21 [Leptospiraceae bacterium]MDW7976474.1 30S ribosomal protein S21 [Leptospiraceae bacterium]
MIGIYLKEGESIDSALRRFKKECVNAGIQSEIKKREFYEKPSEIRKRKRETAERKRRKKLMMLLKKKSNSK